MRVGERRHAVPAQLHVVVQAAANDVQVAVDQARDDAPARRGRSPWSAGRAGPSPRPRSPTARKRPSDRDGDGGRQRCERSLESQGAVIMRVAREDQVAAVVPGSWPTACTDRRHAAAATLRHALATGMICSPADAEPPSSAIRVALASTSSTLSSPDDRAERQESMRTGRDACTALGPRGGLVHHGVGVIDAHAVGAGMLASRSPSPRHRFPCGPSRAAIRAAPAARSPARRRPGSCAASHIRAPPCDVPPEASATM